MVFKYFFLMNIDTRNVHSQTKFFYLRSQYDVFKHDLFAQHFMQIIIVCHVNCLESKITNP